MFTIIDLNPDIPESSNVPIADEITRVNHMQFCTRWSEWQIAQKFLIEAFFSGQGSMIKTRYIFSISSKMQWQNEFNSFERKILNSCFCSTPSWRCPCRPWWRSGWGTPSCRCRSRSWTSCGTSGSGTRTRSSCHGSGNYEIFNNRRAKPTEQTTSYNILLISEQICKTITCFSRTIPTEEIERADVFFFLSLNI